jgi:D-3-phosphoglycerate dehydrogenase
VTSYQRAVAPIRVLLLENVHRSASESLDAPSFHIERVAGALTEDELVARIGQVHLLGIRSKTRITARVLDAAPHLLAVGAFCIGTNQIDLDHANRRGVPVFNAPFSNTRSVAELILAEVVMLSRQLVDRVREVHDGTWNKVAAGCREIRGKVLGIVGYGHIGRQVGVLAEAAGMQVRFHDIAARLPMGNNRPAAGLEDLLATSDFVTLHVPGTPQTRGMIGERELARMKLGAHLLNASRGDIVDHAALAAALTSGRLAGAAIDVYPEEPSTNSDGFRSVLRGLPNVVLTPHIGGSTEEAQEAIGREVASSLRKFIETGATTGAVNFPQLELPRAPGTHRILHVHHNVPGVIRDVSATISARGANIHAQMLVTDPTTGYLAVDVDAALASEVEEAIAALPSSIRTRTVRSANISS